MGQVVRLGSALLVLASLLGLTGCGPRPVSTLTPTPTSGSEPTESIVASGNVRLPLTAPVQLQIGDTAFAVRPVEVQKNQWRYQRGQPDSAQWVYGTLVNYVIGLEATPQNAELFEALTEADIVQLALANGRVLQFQFSGRQWVEQEAAPDVFQQLRPGLTLALLGDKGTQRLVVTASYVASLEPTPAAGPNLAKVGTWVQVGEARVVVLGGQLVKDVAGLADELAYYLVDFSVEALGPGTLDASMFQMDLVDSLDKRYVVSIQASQAGAHGVAGGRLAPGQVLTATAGYLVPEAIGGPMVTWAFSPRPGASSSARFQLTLAAPAPTPDPRSAITIQVNTATYGQGLAEIVVAGGIGNPTDTPITVQRDEVWLESGAARVSLVAANPPFPWSIAPGESRAFTLHFARPSPGTAILRIMHWSFELSGLQ